MFAELDSNWLNWSMVAHFSPDSYFLGNIISFLVTLVLPGQSTSLPPFPLSCLPDLAPYFIFSETTGISTHFLPLISPALSISHCLYLLPFLPSFLSSQNIYSWGYLPGRSLRPSYQTFLFQISLNIHAVTILGRYHFFIYSPLKNHKENSKWETTNKYMISCLQSTFPRRFSKMHKVDFIIASTPWWVDQAKKALTSGWEHRLKNFCTQWQPKFTFRAHLINVVFPMNQSIRLAWSPQSAQGQWDMRKC